MALLTLALVAAACADDPDGEDDAAEADASADEAEPDEDDESDGSGDPGEFELGDMSAIVGFSPGGGYDRYMRMFVPYLEEELGVNITVENRPGAASLVAQNILLHAEPDGSQFMMMNGIGVGLASLGGAEGAEFSLDEYTYLGRVTAQPRMVVVGADSEYDTIEEIIEDWENVTAGAAGAGGGDYADLQIIREALNIPFDITLGFDGSEENTLALHRGDIDLMTGDVDGRRANIEAGDERPMLVIGAERDEHYPDIPTLQELDLDEEGEALAQAYVDLLDLGRPMIAPPGMDEGLTEYLREAFWNVLTNEDFLAEAEEQELPIRPLDGPETQELVESIEQNAPDALRELMD